MRKLPQGIWTDTHLKKKFRFVGYDAPSKCWRIQYIGFGGMRIWMAEDRLSYDDRYTAPTAWDRIEDGMGLSR